jgi:hypothetical protein
VSLVLLLLLAVQVLLGWRAPQLCVLRQLLLQQQ